MYGSSPSIASGIILGGKKKAMAIIGIPHSITMAYLG